MNISKCWFVMKDVKQFKTIPEKPNKLAGQLIRMLWLILLKVILILDQNESSGPHSVNTSKTNLCVNSLWNHSYKNSTKYFFLHSMFSIIYTNLLCFCLMNKSYYISQYNNKCTLIIAKSLLFLWFGRLHPDHKSFHKQDYIIIVA